MCLSDEDMPQMNGCVSELVSDGLRRPAQDVRK